MTTEAPLLEFADAPPERALARRATEALANGGVVAFPTETVYGLAARADDPAALARLRGLKGLEAARALSWHVGTSTALERFPRLRPLVRRLATRYWPGPLTLVVSTADAEVGDLEALVSGGWIGVRHPAHAGTAGLLEALDFPVAMTSANRHGEPPLADAAAIAAAFGDALALVLDDGPPRLGESSGVLAVGPGRFELLREGLLPLADLRRTAGLRIGFVCTGNTCRSPMAEALARRTLATRLGVEPGGEPAFGFALSSMGVFAGHGGPASPHAIEVLRARGIDLTDHRTRPAIDAEVSALDRVYALTASHRDALVAMLPPGEAEHVTLLDPDGGDVADPVGGSREDYARCADRIGQLVEARADVWA